MQYLGLGKTLYHSSACVLDTRAGKLAVEVALSERVLRKKASGLWPERAMLSLSSPLDPKETAVGDSRDVSTPSAYEQTLDHSYPFMDHLRVQGLDWCTSKGNPALRFVNHHLAHAMAAVLMSPFERCLIVVMDGAGSRGSDFDAHNPERRDFHAIQGVSRRGSGFAEDAHEECTVYLHDHGKLKCVFKRWQKFQRDPASPHGFHDGPGILYEKAAEFIFNSNQAAGKVMGLAPLGKASQIQSPKKFLETLNWDLAFRGQGKTAWEDSGRIPLYTELAATVQAEFEAGAFELIGALRKEFPEYDNLILTGGCALNCTTNGKLLRERLFREIYVPPFPGDESIGVGVASYLYHSDPKTTWRALPHSEQHGYFGPVQSVPTDQKVRDAFQGFEIERPDDITEHVASELGAAKVIAWFQGRSESGPRALGNRSILARPDLPGIRDHLNDRVKGRERFRPYGSSCLYEFSQEYFEVPQGFESPYMSFAVKTRAHFADRLREVTHFDGTSRIQTVRETQNPKFHELIRKFGTKTGLFCVLNTSLNVMGQPIVETIEDARDFLIKTPVDGIAVGDCFIRRKADR